MSLALGSRAAGPDGRTRLLSAFAADLTVDERKDAKLHDLRLVHAEAAGLQVEEQESSLIERFPRHQRELHEPPGARGNTEIDGPCRQAADSGAIIARRNVPAQDQHEGVAGAHPAASGGASK